MKQDIASDSTGAQIANANTVNIGIPSTPVTGVPKYLTLRPAKNPNFVGRKNELKQIADDLASDSMVYIVNGIGGIGKSELAYKYLLENEEKYQHIAHLNFQIQRTHLKIFSYLL